MELNYEVLMEENNLTLNDLSGEAKVLVEQLKSTLKGVNMLEKSGKDVSEKTLQKIASLDNLICREINEQLDQNEEEEEEEEEEFEGNDEQDNEEEEEEDEEEPQQPVKGDPRGEKIDSELAIAHQSGKKEITLDELKTISPTAYQVIFEGYDESGDNGVETTLFSLIETDDEVFTLTKK